MPRNKGIGRTGKKHKKSADDNIHRQPKATTEPTVATEAPEPPAESHNEPEMEHITSISQALAWWLAKRSPRCHVCVRTSRVAELYSEAGQRLVVK